MNGLSKLMSILLVFSLVFCMFSVSSEAVSANLVDKLKRDKWYADGDIDNYIFYYIGSDNQIHIGRTEYRYGNWETPYFQGDSHGTYSYNKNTNTISFEQPNYGDGNYYIHYEIIDLGLDDILILKTTDDYPWSDEYSPYTYYTPIFREGGFSVEHTPDSDTPDEASEMFNKYKSTCWYSNYLNTVENYENENVNYIWLYYSLYAEFGQHAVVGTNKKAYNDIYWAPVYNANCGYCLAINEGPGFGHIYLTEQNGSLYALIISEGPEGYYHVEKLERYFPDVPKNAWYYGAVKYVSDKGYINGYSTGKFGAVDNLKRQDFVVILSKITGADLDKYAAMTPKLKDVKKGAYYAAAVNWAVDNNIIAGYANGNFGVNDNITREQVATILYRYMGSPEVKDINKTLAKFSDVNRISSFAKTAVAWAVQNNVISGMADGRVASAEGASRAQIASIIMRMDQQGMFNK
ncbi:MAG: S-layer homology domain-containing protein [Clostridia bacterium]|nr:S-layer homology domain-containing protein [Clostridia bacterium]